MIQTLTFYIRRYGSTALMWMLMHLFRIIFPIKKNKIVATAARGRKYADNPRFIVEELLRRNRNLDIVWLQRKGFNMEVPEGVRLVRNTRNHLQLAYEYSTAQIIIESAHVELYFSKRKGQTFINTWHGGLGIKRIEYDANNIGTNKIYLEEIDKTTRCADVFISNSDHLSRIYRSAFRYNGAIFNCGYPKNDELFGDKEKCRINIRKILHLPTDVKIVTYAPTFRDYFNTHGKWNVDMKVYDLDYERLRHTLEEHFHSKVAVLIKMHPNMQMAVNLKNVVNDHIFDVTKFNNIQDIIMASDYFVSDYSSCIFDAALIGIPCFTYATDIEEYKSDGRGVYYEMEELPFPYAKNNDEMEQNILTYDEHEYHEKWIQFAKRVGLNETGHAAKDIADKICDILDGKEVNWNNSDI